MMLEQDWQKAVIPAWKLLLLRVRFPRRTAVTIRGHTYLIRPPASIQR